MMSCANFVLVGGRGIGRERGREEDEKRERRGREEGEKREKNEREEGEKWET